MSFLKKIFVYLLLACQYASADPDKDLIKAIRAGNISDVKKALASGARSNSKDSFGRTPLMKATGMRGSAPDKDNPLHMTEIARLLVDNKADVDAQDYKGNTALIMAVQEGNEDTVKLLLSAGADPYIVNKAGKKALGFATKGPIKELIVEDEQLKEGALRHEKAEEPSKIDAQEGRRKESIAVQGSEELDVTQEDIENAVKDTAFDSDYLADLLAYPFYDTSFADDKTGKSKILLLARLRDTKEAGYYQKVKTILQKNSDTAFQIAEVFESPELLRSPGARRIFLKKVNLNLIDGNGYSLLMRLIKKNPKNLLDIMNFFLDHKAKVAIKAEDNETALSLAKKIKNSQEREQAVAMLKKVGARE